jgi:hypothetical protein
MRWAGHVKSTGRCMPNFGLKSLMNRDQFADIGTDGRMMLKWIVQKYCFESVDWIQL